MALGYCQLLFTAFTLQQTRDAEGLLLLQATRVASATEE